MQARMTAACKTTPNTASKLNEKHGERHRSGTTNRTYMTLSRKKRRKNLSSKKKALPLYSQTTKTRLLIETKQHWKSIMIQKPSQSEKESIRKTGSIQYYIRKRPLRIIFFSAKNTHAFMLPPCGTIHERQDTPPNPYPQQGIYALKTGTPQREKEREGKTPRSMRESLQDKSWRFTPFCAGQGADTGNEPYTSLSTVKKIPRHSIAIRLKHTQIDPYRKNIKKRTFHNQYKKTLYHHISKTCNSIIKNSSPTKVWKNCRT